ncbi:MAG: 2TM domain-containing protein [Proteobacteria bacterium]|nr:2TM domain-containing protein [Pseudomonadota bacterium]
MASRGSIIGFGYHLTAYLAINAVLLWINFDTTPDYLWATWPIAGWGIGIAFHGLSVVLSSNKFNKGFLYHLGAFAMVNAFLVFVNFRTSPDYLWFKFPLVAWSAMILFHGWFMLSKNNTSHKTS